MTTHTIYDSEVPPEVLMSGPGSPVGIEITLTCSCGGLLEKIVAPLPDDIGPMTRVVEEKHLAEVGATPGR